MYNTQIIENIEGVRCFVDGTGTAYLNLEDVARGLGFTRIATSGNKVVRWERVEKHLVTMGLMSVPTSGHGGNEEFATCNERPEFIEEPYFYWLAMKAGNKTAEAFQRKVAFDILPTIRRTGCYFAISEEKQPARGGEAASLIGKIDRIAVASCRTPLERAEIADAICRQMGVYLPPCFTAPPQFEQIALCVRK